MYLGVIFLVSPDSGESFSLSRELVTDNKKQSYDYLLSESHSSPNEVDTILILESKFEFQHKGDTVPIALAPEVISFWRAANGDFEGL